MWFVRELQPHAHARTHARVHTYAISIPKLHCSVTVSRARLALWLNTCYCQIKTKSLYCKDKRGVSGNLDETVLENVFLLLFFYNLVLPVENTQLSQCHQDAAINQSLMVFKKILFRCQFLKLAKFLDKSSYEVRWNKNAHYPHQSRQLG